MAPSGTGLRERKKQATRRALRTAALRLALERGPENVRVDDIAEAAGVSPRTYNNYFASREHDAIAAVVGERDERIAAAVRARQDVSLADAVLAAVVEQYTDPGDDAREVLLLITSSQALRVRYAEAVAELDEPLAAAIGERLGGDDLTARVLAAAVGAAAKVAVQQWLRSSAAPAAPGGLVVPSGSLPALVRAALSPLVPALDAASRPGV